MASEPGRGGGAEGSGGSALLTKAGLGVSNATRPSHTFSSTSSGALNAIHTATRPGATRRKMGPARTSGRSIAPHYAKIARVSPLGEVSCAVTPKVRAKKNGRFVGTRADPHWSNRG